MPGWPKLRGGSGIQGALAGICGASSLIMRDSSSSLAAWSDAAPVRALLNSERASNLKEQRWRRGELRRVVEGVSVVQWGGRDMAGGSIHKRARVMKLAGPCPAGDCLVQIKQGRQPCAAVQELLPATDVLRRAAVANSTFDLLQIACSGLCCQAIFSKCIQQLPLTTRRLCKPRCLAS